MVLAAVTQMTSGPNILKNCKTAVDLIARASKAGAKLVALPEATDFVAPSKQVGELAYSKDNEEFNQRICAAAKEHGVFVSVGIHEPAEGGKEHNKGRCWNTQLVIDDKGEVQGRYRKTHLFDVEISGGMTIKESDTTIPGPKLQAPITTPVGALGPLTCYDLRFPEPSLYLRSHGAQVISYPSAFVARTGAAHWEPLLRARAIETQCYVMASAQVGNHEGTERTTWGHAMIVDGWGSIVAQCGDMQPYKAQYAIADVDLENLDQLRKEMPLWEQRRNRAPEALYATI